ncbi:hypothetical protein [Nocardioides sp. SYSU D00038]|uniref:hypothetical protein n=1 Tax=Nocardioides sp. SYSU D00038 TaxID=2812554 RepID=UPI0019670E0C|nr:hypothetical protein [Nocardioides sp. SYSU D00038]
MRTALLVVAALLLGLLVAAPSASVERRTSVTLKPVPASSQAGRKVTLRGVSSEGRAKVRLQRRHGTGRWSTVATVRPDRRGRFSTRVTLTRGGPTSFRAVRGRSRSKVRTVAVYAWLDLVDQPLAVLDGPAYTDRLSVVGRRSLPRSIEGDPNTWLGVRTAGLCTTFETWTGFLDSQRAKRRAGDRQETYLARHAASGALLGEFPVVTPLGPAKRAAASIIGTQLFTVRTGLDVLTNDDRPRSVLGSPRLLCNAAVLPAVTPGTLQPG